MNMIKKDYLFLIVAILSLLNELLIILTSLSVLAPLLAIICSVYFLLVQVIEHYNCPELSFAYYLHLNFFIIET